MSNLVPLRLQARRAEQIINELSMDSSNVILTTHAKERMEARGIDRTDVDRILRTGCVMDEPHKNERGEWQCKIVRRIAGNRDAGVVTVIQRMKTLIVRTVEWEDMR